MDDYRAPHKCGSTENHPAHDWDKTRERWNGSTYVAKYRCAGQETTHWVVVTDAEGNEMGRIPVDIRAEFDGSEMSDLRATVELEAKHSGKPLSQTEKEVLLAIGTVAPEVCPFDSEGCHEELWDFRESLKDEEEEA